jgi:DNA-binding NarL/FixJ family response regulator
MKKFRILIADDHAMIRDGVKALLSKNENFEVVDEAVDGEQAVSKFRSLKPDLLILDISMPNMNGMDTVKIIIKEFPDAKIIILSMFDDDDYIDMCMQYGVKGYVVKNESGDELEYAVKCVLNGQTFFSTQVQKSIFRKYTDNVVRKKEREPEVKLTIREIEIIKLISEGLTSLQMADKLFISPRTVETHRANLMKKLAAKNAIELVKKARQLQIVS